MGSLSENLKMLEELQQNLNLMEDTLDKNEKENLEKNYEERDFEEAFPGNSYSQPFSQIPSDAESEEKHKVFIKKRRRRSETEDCNSEEEEKNEEELYK